MVSLLFSQTVLRTSRNTTVSSKHRQQTTMYLRQRWHEKEKDRERGREREGLAKREEERVRETKSQGQREERKEREG